MGKAIVLFVAFLGLFLRFSNSAIAETNEFYLIKTDKYEGIIVPAAKGENFCYLRNTEKYWTLVEEDITKAEEGVYGYLKQASPKRSPELAEKLYKYNRQYTGAIVNGEKKIYMSFFCDALDVDWKKRPVLMVDGGDCYFHITYDVESGNFSELFINSQ